MVDAAAQVPPVSNLWRFTTVDGADLAILWVDSHPDMGTGETAYPGFHAMVVSALTGHGDRELLQILPATTAADRVALVMDGRIERVGSPTEVMAYARIRMAEASRGQTTAGAAAAHTVAMLA